MTVGLWLTALGLGLRHGIDWDHIAAIADLTSTAENRRRGFMLSFLYAVGHAVVVMILGVVAILFGAALPEGVDVWMGRVVGITLVALGSWVLIELIRKGRDFRLRSRWILVISGTFAGLRRVREANARRRLTIEHDHEHEHAVEAEHSAVHDAEHQIMAVDEAAHDHAHIEMPTAGPEELIDLTEVDALTEALVGTGTQEQIAGSSRRARLWHAAGRHRSHSHSHSQGRREHSQGRRQHSHSHSHSHRHETSLVESGAGTGNGTAAGIGLLHGVGFESPTQIAVFVASTSLVGAWAGVGLLVAWVLGLVVANSILAGLAGFGLLNAERNFVIYATIAAFVGAASLAIGIMLLVGIDGVLPAI